MARTCEPPSISATVQLCSDDRDGSDGEYDIRCWSGSIRVPSEVFVDDPGVEIGRMKMFTVDLRAGSALPSNLHLVYEELADVGAHLFNDDGECAVVDGVDAASTMAVVEYVQLARVWRGDGIGPAAAVLAANMIANDLSIVVAVPGYMDVEEDCVSGSLTGQYLGPDVDEIAMRKITHSFRDAGFSLHSRDSGIHYLRVGTETWCDALDAARERLCGVPVTGQRQDWLHLRTRSFEPDFGGASTRVGDGSFDWEDVDTLIDMCARRTAQRQNSACWESLSAAANDVTRQILDRIDVEQMDLVDMWVTFADVRVSGSHADLPEWFLREEPLCCAVGDPRLARLLRLVAVFGGTVVAAGAETELVVTVFNQRIVTIG